MKRGFICGVFDLFHFGHVLALRECRENCDHLTVALNSARQIDPVINPGKKQPVFPLEHRIEIMRECRLVDEVLSYSSESELAELLEKGDYDIRFLGADYQGKPVTGAGFSRKIHFLNREHGFSTSYFRNILCKD